MNVAGQAVLQLRHTRTRAHVRPAAAATAAAAAAVGQVGPSCPPVRLSSHLAAP